MSRVCRGTAEALVALAEGQVVGIPTDTVYGLVIDPTREGAFAALYRAKGRPDSVPLQVLVADLEQAEGLVAGGVLPRSAKRLAERHWPGGLTMVLPRAPGLGFELGGDGYSIGLRCPAHPLARGLCSEAGPLGASSANLHHQRPLLTAAEISEAFGESVPVVVDGGACGGTASTVVDLTGDEPRCLREGSIPWSVILEVLAGS